MANGNNPSPRSQTKPAPKGPVWRKNDRGNTVCAWSDIDATSIRGCLDAVTKAGGAFMFGLTADGGAYSICILQDNEKIKEYPHGKVECEEVLESIAHYYADYKL